MVRPGGVCSSGYADLVDSSVLAPRDKSLGGGLEVLPDRNEFRHILTDAGDAKSLPVALATVMEYRVMQ
jgi:hypothetical protein